MVMNKKPPRLLLMKNLRNKKILSECSNVPHSLYLGHGGHINSAEKVDDCSAKHSSNSPTKNGSANMFSRTPSTLKITLVEDHPVPLGNATYLTPDKGEAEVVLNDDQTPVQVTPSIDFSAFSEADFGFSPASFTQQQKGESQSLLKKFRRRSTIGARGSPENNSLIQYIACQKRTWVEKPSSQASPFKHHSVLLKDKIAAFQSSFKPLEEAEERTIQMHNNCIQSQCIPEEVSGSAASQQSCKKVRFAEKESLEIFDQSKPPITPLQKGQFPSSVLDHDGACLRSVLKKPLEHIDDSSSREGSEAPLTIETCGPLLKESNTKPVNEIEEDYKDLDANVLAALPLVHTPLLRGADPCSPSESRNYSAIMPIKQPLPQPNFDNEDDLLPGSSEAVPTKTRAVNSDLEETENSSPDPQATCCRITRSSLKRKNFSKQLVRAAEMQSKRAPTKQKIPKPNKVVKAKSKKAPASRHKVFGKRRRKKKEQKALYGQRETVSKKPLLSPIPELKEDLSFASYRSTPRSQNSILDYSDSSDDCVEYLGKLARKENGALQNPIVDSTSLNLSLDLVKDDALPDIQLVTQLQDAIITAGENTFPSDPPGKNSPAKLRSIINTKQVLKSDCSSNETKMQKELEFLGEDTTDKKNAGRTELDLARDSPLELTNGEVHVNFKRFPRRSRRLSHHLPNVGDDQLETPRNNSCVPRSPLKDDSVLLNDLQCSIEESFRHVPNNDQKRVRRSMRRRKDGEHSGLAWINIPAENTTSQGILGCTSKAQRQTCPSNLEELEGLCQRQERFQVLLPVKEDQENDPVVMDPCRSKAGRRRRSFCTLSLEENQNIVLPPWRNRRASLGYRSDQCYRKDSEIRKLFVNQPTVLI